MQFAHKQGRYVYKHCAMSRNLRYFNYALLPIAGALMFYSWIQEFVLITRLSGAVCLYSIGAICYEATMKTNARIEKELE